MKLQKKWVLLLALVFVVSSTPRSMGAQFKNYDEFNYKQLKQIAVEKGHVRVIVEMEVPAIAELTALSTAFKTGNSVGDEYYKQSAFNADLVLDEAISAARDTVLHGLNGTRYRLNRSFSTIPYAALSVTAEALEKLKSLPGVLRIVEDKRIPLPVSEKAGTDNGHSGLDGPHLGRSTEIVGARFAWDLGLTGRDWYVAVLDTGIRPSHEMFQGKDIVEHCFSLGEDRLDYDNGGCPNGEIEMDGPGSAAHPGGAGHGSHVAGIVAGNNGVDRFGVAKDANIIAVNVFTYFPGQQDETTSWISDSLSGLEYVYTLRNTYKIASVNMSVGSLIAYPDYCDSAIRADVIQNLKAAGIATVISSGNEGHCDAVSNPGCVRGAITVGATDKDDESANFGNWHDYMVDLLAPGVAIDSVSADSDSGYTGKTGTSFSAPHVAGAWAIMKQYDENMTTDDILTTLQDSGTIISSTKCENAAPKPRLDIAEAFIGILSIAPPLNLTAEQHYNRSFLQIEYVNQLNWESNPFNADKNVAYYRIYVVENGVQLNRAAEVGGAAFSYLHRDVNRLESMTYAITAVNDQGEESPPIYHTIEFGLEQ